MNRAVFFDRDGTLNDDPGFLADPAQLHLLPGAAEAIRLAREAGFLTVLITNQSGVARGLIDEEQLHAVHDRLRELLAAEQVQLDAIYYCPHHPDGVVEPYRLDCQCRKPAPGLLLQAAADLNIDLARSFMVGDRLTDVEAAVAAGAQPVFLSGDSTEAPGAAFTATGVLEAVRRIAAAPEL